MRAVTIGVNQIRRIAKDADGRTTPSKSRSAPRTYNITVQGGQVIRLVQVEGQGQLPVDDQRPPPPPCLGRELEACLPELQVEVADRAQVERVGALRGRAPVPPPRPSLDRLRTLEQAAQAARIDEGRSKLSTRQPEQYVTSEEQEEHKKKNTTGRPASGPEPSVRGRTFVQGPNKTPNQ